MNYIDCNPKKHSGVPVIKGTRFAISSLLAEFIDRGSLDEVCNTFDLSKEDAKNALHELAFIIDNKEFVILDSQH